MQRQSRQDYHNLHPKIIARSSILKLSVPCISSLHETSVRRDQKPLVFEPPNLPFPSDLSTTTDWKMVLNKTYWYSPILRLYVCCTYCVLLFVRLFLYGLRLTYYPPTKKTPSSHHNKASCHRSWDDVDEERCSDTTADLLSSSKHLQWECQQIQCLGQGRNYLWSKELTNQYAFRKPLNDFE